MLTNLLSVVSQLTKISIDWLGFSVGNLLEHISYMRTPKLNTSIAVLCGPSGFSASGAAYNGLRRAVERLALMKLAEAKSDSLGCHWSLGKGLRSTFILALLISQCSIGL